MSIGYACKTLGVVDTNLRYCLLKDATEDKLMEIIKHNIISLEHSINYNIENNIKLFRISSDLIPFGSSPVNNLEWWVIFQELLRRIGQKIIDCNMRVSLHPGQYTVLNSAKRDVVEKAVQDLAYHSRVLDSLGVDATHKIILHIGGAYQDKKTSAMRFMENYLRLEDSIRRRLVIENDDKIYNIQDVFEIGMQLNIPVIFDNLHNEINPSEDGSDEFTWIEKCGDTWREQDGNQKIHYSQQAMYKKIGSHSDFISIDSFLEFYRKIGREDIDIMLEVKDKNLSCVKCINCITDNYEHLDKEWNKYKYTILEKSISAYNEIDKMLLNKVNLSPVTFYRLIEQSIDSNDDIDCRTKALDYIWEDCFENRVTEKENRLFHKNLLRYQQQQTGFTTVKNQLKKLAEKYEQTQLTNSYYFLL